MSMQALVYEGSVRYAWQERPEPTLADDGDALVRPLAVTTCDLDGAIATGLLDGMETGYPVGHEVLAEVIDVGDAITAVGPGRRVLVPFQVSCGGCRPCRTGRSAACSTVGSQRFLGLPSGGTRWGGGLADLLRVPWADRLCVPVPDGATEAVAAVGDNASDGWRTVGPYLAEVEGPVLVDGFASVGLYAVAFAVGAGATVHYRDRDEGRRDLARRLGAEVLEQPTTERAERRYELVVSTPPDEESLLAAMASTASGGRLVTTGLHIRPSTGLPLYEMYLRSIRVVNEAVQAREVVEQVLADAASVDLEQFVTRVAWDDADAALADQEGKLLLVR